MLPYQDTSAECDASQSMRFVICQKKNLEAHDGDSVVLSLQAPAVCAYGA